MSALTIEGVLETWQPYYEQQLCRDDAESLIQNWSAYLNVISEWMATKYEDSKGIDNA